MFGKKHPFLRKAFLSEKKRISFLCMDLGGTKYNVVNPWRNFAGVEPYHYQINISRVLEAVKTPKLRLVFVPAVGNTPPFKSNKPREKIKAARNYKETALRHKRYLSPITRTLCSRRHCRSAHEPTLPRIKETSRALQLCFGSLTLKAWGSAGFYLDDGTRG